MIDLSDCRRIHCIGIGGIGLSAIADILIERNYEVTGSDMKAGDMVRKLEEKGAKVFIGHNASNVEGADLVVYTVAVSDDNPELVRAKELGIPTVTRAQMLGKIMEEYDYSIAVSGTHGKTTTTSMVSLILKNAGKDPTIAVGGNLPEIGGNVAVGNSKYFVTEACEYRDSFLNLKPTIEIILNIDSDHLDYFKDIDHIVDSFNSFADIVSKNGSIIAYSANPFVNSVIKNRENIITFGFSEDCTYCGSDITFREGMPSFTISSEGRELARIQLQVPGEHNILNAMAAFVCAHMLGVEVSTIVDTLEAYTGTARRFDIQGHTKDGRTVVDDYAHHPTEIRATLKAALNVSHRELWCIFQPHTYTRTLALFEQFGKAFEDADKVVLTEIYAAREKNTQNISSQDLLNEIKKNYPDKEVYFYPDKEAAAEFVYKKSMPGDLILTMGAGDVYLAGEQILKMDGEN